MSHFKNADSSMSYEIREWTKGETFFPNFDPIKAAIKASLVTRRGKYNLLNQNQPGPRGCAAPRMESEH